MRLSYYGSIISPNITEAPEGFLICKNVPIARTGDMEYLRSELGLDGDPYQKVIVQREESEVFSPAAIASFEGKPVTDDHPSEDVEPYNYSNYAKGHVQNVRRGTGDDSDKLVADLFIANPTLINEVSNSIRREVSCGYSCTYTPNEDGTFSQRQIRGNHVAVVGQGRAGKSVCIKDSVPALTNQNRKERISMKRRVKDAKRSILRLLARSVRDAKDADEIEEVIEETAEVLEEKAGDSEQLTFEEAAEDSAKKGAKDEQPFNSETIDAVVKKALCEALPEALKALLPVNDNAEEEAEAESAAEDEDLIGKMIKQLSETGGGVDDEDIAEQEEALTVEAESMDSDNSELMAESTVSNDTAIAILKSARPAIAKIKDAKERKSVTDALLSSIYGQLKSPMSSIMKATSGAARKKASDSASGETIDIAAQQAIYDKRNPHLKKEDK